MGNVVQFIPRARVETYFGVCPHCNRNDGYLNVGAEHWFICDQHRVKWYVGSNLFSSWRDDDEATQLANLRLLNTYDRIEPLLPLGAVR